MKDTENELKIDENDKYEILVGKLAVVRDSLRKLQNGHADVHCAIYKYLGERNKCFNVDDDFLIQEAERHHSYIMAFGQCLDILNEIENLED